MKKEMDKKMVNSIGDFEYTIIWMSMRYWMRNSDLYETDAEYPSKLLERCWDGLSEIQREKIRIDIKRESETGWASDKKRVNELMNTFYNGEGSGLLFTPYPKCDDFEFLMIRMAISYACGRQTIASSTLPGEIIEHRYEFLSDDHKNIIVSDLRKYLDYLKNHNIDPVFGNPMIDNNTWLKFMTALDKSEHEEVELINGEKVTVFRTTSLRGHWNEEEKINKFSMEEVVYPLESYLKDPHREIYVLKENIINFF